MKCALRVSRFSGKFSLSLSLFALFKCNLLFRRCVAQACPESFAPYYDQFMPGIKNILVEATSPELMELRGKAMECAGLIGDAVGVERFSRDAIEIMRVFFSLLVITDHLL